MPAETTATTTEKCPEGQAVPRSALPGAAFALRHRLLLLAVGWGLIGIAIPALLRAGLGVGPLDVLNAGLAERLGVQVGTASWLSNGAILVLAMVLGARPGIATFAGAFVVGFLVNTTLPLMPAPVALQLRVLMLAMALVMLYIGITLVLVTGMGAGSVDLMMFELAERGVSLRMARWGLEVVMALAGALLGGAAGFATVLIALTLGPVLQRLIPLFEARLAALRRVSA